jgi:hypothetical protein
MYPDVQGSPTGWSTHTGTGSGVRESQSGCFLYRCASLQRGTRRSRDHQNRDRLAPGLRSEYKIWLVDNMSFAEYDDI